MHRLRDKQGRYLPLGNVEDWGFSNKERFSELEKEVSALKNHSAKQADTKPAPQGSGLKRVLLVGAVLGGAYGAWKLMQMLDIKKNIKVGVNRFYNARMLGKTGFGFSLEVKLVNPTKSSMNISQPFVTIYAQRAGGNGKPEKKIELTHSATNIKGGATIEGNKDTLLNFDFSISFLSMIEIATLLNPLTFFPALLAEIKSPTGAGGKPNFPALLAGTGVSFWETTVLYANGIKVEMSEQII